MWADVEANLGPFGGMNLGCCGHGADGFVTFSGMGTGATPGAGSAATASASNSTPTESGIAECQIPMNCSGIGPTSRGYISILVADVGAAATLAECTTRVCFGNWFGNNGWWLGNNGKWVNVNSQPNGYTGPRNSVLRAAEQNGRAFRAVSRSLTVASVALEGQEMYRAISSGDGLAVLDSGDDLMMIAPTVLGGPVGLGLGLGYAVIDNAIGFENISRGLRLDSALCWALGGC